jgi:hypothetical protein
MVPGYGDSFTVWCSPTPGTVLWPFQFRDGYIDKAYVRVRYKDSEGIWWPVKITVKDNFEEDYVLRIDPPIPPCELVDIYRETPKDGPIVIYGRGGTILLDESRNAAVRQSMHVVVELKELANRTDLECLCDCVEG